MTAESPNTFLVREGDKFLPTLHAQGPWNPQSLHGRVIAGLLGRSLERNHDAEAFHCARLTVDLFRLPPMAPLQVRTEMVREGNRIRVADASVSSEGVELARARAVMLRRTDDPGDDTWCPPNWDVPSPDQLAAPTSPVRFSGIWETRPINDERGVVEQKRTWLRETRLLVEGEALTPFVRWQPPPISPTPSPTPVRRV
jgi:hypothetical protein